MFGLSKALPVIVAATIIGVPLAEGAQPAGRPEKEVPLDDVVVTATTRERSIRDLGGMASVVGAEDYATTGLGIERLLANEELLYVQGGNYPGSESSIAMRGPTSVRPCRSPSSSDRASGPRTSGPRSPGWPPHSASAGCGSPSGRRVGWTSS